MNKGEKGMFPIGEAAQMTGLPAYTIRYYEKIGLLPSAQRRNGKDRGFTEKDIQYLQFLIDLKSTGMTLEEIKEIVVTGCLLDLNPEDHKNVVSRRREILSRHLINLKKQQEKLEQVISITSRKIELYDSFCEDRSQSPK
jgi:DNA-binding transcriptional MerR regulator